VITIDYFSDILCVWAYSGQIRLEALERTFGDQVLIRHRFIPLFADTRTKIAQSWKDRGGFAGFGRHTQEVCAQWEHTRLSPKVWTECRPASCTTAHVFLKAVALSLGVGDDKQAGDADDPRRLDRLVALTRTAFFEQGQDVSSLVVLLDLLGDTGVTAEAVRARIDSGEAYAALQRDAELAKSYGVLGSPTYVFNEGRQLLYGNVGYRIVEANLRELMSTHQVDGEPSWC
jgi:predicted DsbA family dithiol-disulfide isomerase